MTAMIHTTVEAWASVPLHENRQWFETNQIPFTAARLVDSAAFHQLITPHRRAAAAMDRRPSSAAVANSKLCLSRPWKTNCLFEIDGPFLDSLVAGGENLALNPEPKFSASSAVLGPAGSFYELNWTSSSRSKVRFLLHCPSALWSS